MAMNLITWYSKFFKDCGLGNGNLEGCKRAFFKREMMVYSYKVKQKFFEESSMKIWRMKDGVERNFAAVCRALKNSYSNFWRFDWDFETVNWLELELIDGKQLLITIDTNIAQAKFEVYYDELGKEKCKSLEENK